MPGDEQAIAPTGTIHVGRPSPHVVSVVIDRPPANAMDPAMLRRLSVVLAEADADLDVRAIVLTGRGEFFCSGADLKAARAQGEAEGVASFGQVLGQVAGLRAPVIAAVNGACAGGGLELALACDIRIAARNACFICAGVNVGLLASAWRLPRLVGVARAKSMLLTGLPVEAETAERWGLVTAVHKPSGLIREAVALAQRIASRAPLSVEAAKRLADRALDLDEEAARAAQSAAVRPLLASRDHREALAAFAEKREPVFRRG